MSVMKTFAALCVVLGPWVQVRSEEDMLPMRTEQDGGSSNPDQSAFRHVVPLNSVTFAGNVIKSKYVKNWIVLYCVPWFKQCEEKQAIFHDLASKMHRARNDQLTMLSSEVRFAQVDCSTNKPLCNAMNVDTYPVIMHYHGTRQSRWSGGYGSGAQKREKIDLAPWVDKRLDDPSNVQTTLGPIAAAWQGLDQDTKQLFGGLACVGVLVWSLTQCLDQFTQLAKLQIETTKKMQQTGADHQAAAFLAVSPKVPEAPTSQPRDQLIDLDALLVAAVAPLPAAPASLEL